ncbi:MAG: radical SAM protein [Candidatus Woesearchaeota archaeon]
MRKVFFLHAPKQDQNNNEILLVPLGLVALSNYLKDNGLECEIIHTGVERLLNPYFNLIDFLKEEDAKVVSLPLHWHQQSHSTISLAKQIRQNIPECKIILGGFTASFFHEEIMDKFQEIDFIIRGDSEQPLLNLVRSDFEEERLRLIPNLSWRSGKGIRHNPQTYTTSQKILDSLRFSDLISMKNGEAYSKTRINNPDSILSASEGIFYYNTGRGCPVNCSFCGGSNVSQCMINKRNKVMTISEDAILRELSAARESGMEIWYTCFDPFPYTHYYPRLFRKIRERGINLASQFECWALPTREFIDEFEKTFRKDLSQIIISPETGSDEVRKKNKGFFYTNKELLQCMNYINGKGISIVLYMTAGLPFEHKRDVAKTAKLIDYIKKKFDDVEINVLPIGIEPASPLFMNPEKYSVIAKRFSFSELEKIHEKEGDPNYETKELSAEEIKRLIRALQVRAQQ